MNEPAGLTQLETLIARVLHYGTLTATVFTLLGVLLSFAGRSHVALLRVSTQLITVGIAVFILLPITRVTLMLAVFLLKKNRRFAAIAAFVLLIILVSAAVGFYLPSHVHA